MKISKIFIVGGMAVIGFFAAGFNVSHAAVIADYLTVNSVTRTGANIVVDYNTTSTSMGDQVIYLATGYSNPVLAFNYSFNPVGQSWFLTDYALVGQKSTPGGCAQGGNMYPANSHITQTFTNIWNDASSTDEVIGSNTYSNIYLVLVHIGSYAGACSPSSVVLDNAELQTVTGSADSFISVASPTAPLYQDFNKWTFNATTTPGHVYGWDIQYDTAPWTDPGYCAQSPGAIDSAATTTINSSNPVLTLNKGTPITPYSTGFTNPVNGNGYLTTLYLKACIHDYTDNISHETYSTMPYNYGGAPLNTGGASTTLTFIFPTSTSYVYPPLYSFAILGNGVASNTIYTLHTTEQVIGVTPIVGNSVNFNGSQILGNGFYPVNELYNYDFGTATSVPITANATLLVGNTVLATTSITFNMLTYQFVNSSGTTVNPNGTTTFNSPIPEVINGQLTGNATNTVVTGAVWYNDTIVCTPPGGFTDLGGGISWGLCEVGKILFHPSSKSVYNVTMMFDNIKGDFPFNMVYGTLGTFSNIAQGVQYNTIYAGTDLADPKLSLPIYGMDIPILSSSTLSGFVGQSNKNLIFSTETSIAWVAVVWTIIKIIF